jgi:hypothetical protein
MRPTTLHVFVSSTWLDLQPERQAVEAALQRLRETKFIGMEYFGSRDETTRQASLAEVDRCQVYVGLFGGRYGSGITEAEYHRARERSLPCFIYVKDDAAIPSEGRETDPEQVARLAALKAKLRDPSAHTVSVFTTPDDLAAKVTADLYLWLFDHYLAPQLDQAAREGFSREEGEALLAWQREAGAIIAQGNRSVAVGQDLNCGILITGDHNILYHTIVHHYPPLKDYIIPDFSELISTKTPWFVGREAIFAALQVFQARHPCGYFRITADAGLGKTALAAEIARLYRAPAFFANMSQNWTRPDQCLNHLSVECIVRFGLEYDHLPSKAGEDSTFFRQVLADAVRKAGGPLWVVVDALDEADSPLPGRNSLLLPDHLPDDVYLVLTHRPGEYSLVTDPHTPIEEYAIAWNDPTQQADINTYLRRQAERPEIRRALREPMPPIPVERFVARLQDVSQGNFKYLDYVIADIITREPGFDPLNLDGFPKGLNGYYQQFWDCMEQVRSEEGWAEWRTLYRPVIALLGAAREPITVDWLAGFVDRPAEEIHEQALARWRRFLSRERREGRWAWRIVHRSFADFLADKNREKVDVQATHARIADRYLKTWGGLEAGLPGLQDATMRDLADGYGLRHLAAHLSGAQRVEDLHRLLASETAEHRNTWYEVHYRLGQAAVYLADIARAWQWAETLTANHIARGQMAPSVGLEVRYALITASFHSLAGQILPDLMLALVEKGLWAPAQGLAYAQQVPEDRHQAEVLMALAPHLPEPLLREALAAARTLENMRDRARVLATLAPHLPEPLLREALAAARTLENAYVRADALAALIPHLPEPLLGEALAAARTLGDKNLRARALTALAPHLPEPLLGEALAAARTLGDEDLRARALTALAPHLPEPLRSEGLGEALAAVRLGNAYKRAHVLATLAPHLPEPLLREALAAARTLGDADLRARALTALAPQLATLSQALLHPLWTETLHTFSIRTRRYLLADLQVFIPVIFALGGIQAVAETAQAIQDVGRWWP